MTLLYFAIAIFAAASATTPVEAQILCRGDLDGDRVVTAADAEPLLEVLFDVEGFDEESLEIADVNQDGDVSIADVVGVHLLDGAECPGSSATRTPTATPTRTPTGGGGTPTRTPTRSPSTTPTGACLSAPLGTGTTNGNLTTGDCEIEINREFRLADEYTFLGAANQELHVEVQADGFEPWIRIVDPNGWFGVAEGTPPLDVRLTGDRTYSIFVASRPGTGNQVGSYSLSASTRTCTADTLTTRVASFDASDCGDPSFPSFGGGVELADVYTFTVSQPLSLISITMRQSREESLVDPMFAVFGPDGYEVFPAFQADDQATGGFGFDAAARFLAFETGTYTLVATSGGCDPEDEEGCGYRIQFSNTTCPTTTIDGIPDTVRTSIDGIHWGDPTRTRCGAPLPIPGGAEDGIPEIGSPSDVYQFTGNAGDVITLEMESEDEGQLYLIGPETAGRPLIAVDGDDSGNLLAQIGVVLPFSGTYTVIAANKNFLFAPDPEDPEDEGEFVEYTLFLQKCPVQGAISTAATTPRNDTFSAIDCVGSGDVPVRSYALSLTAGDFVDVTMTSAAIDTFLTLIGPDGVRISNDDDPLTPGSQNSRLARIVPITGAYYVEASAPPEESVTGSPAFSLRARTCATTAVATGSVSGTLSDSDCALDNGRRFDVLTYDAPADASTNPSIAGIVPDDGVCVWPLLPGNAGNFGLRCDSAPVEVPVARTGRHGWLAVGTAPATRGAYSLDFVRCAASPLEFGAGTTGLLQAGDCADAAGQPSEWFMIRENAPFVRFATGAEGSWTTGFPGRLVFSGTDGSRALPQSFAVDSEELVLSGENLLGPLKLQGATPADSGAFDLSIDIPDRRQ